VIQGVEETAEPLVFIGRGWETRWRFYEGGIVGGGESRLVGSPGRTRSGAGQGWEARARWVGSMHWRTKMHPHIYRPALFHTQGMEYYSIPEPTTHQTERPTIRRPAVVFLRALALQANQWTDCRTVFI
jgi:hypothetical protein